MRLGWDIIFGMYVDELSVVKCELQVGVVIISEQRGKDSANVLKDGQDA